MASGTPKSPAVLFILLITILPSSTSLPIPIPNPITFHSLFSLSHSLLTRVATLRAARGDISGSIRARTLAHNIKKHSRGFSFYGVVWSVGSDYLKNYAWRDVKTASFEMVGAVSDMNELVKGLGELVSLESKVDRVEWVRRNYETLLKVSKSLVNRLLRVFSQPGPLKDAVEMVRTEIVDGGLLQDCLELGSNDLKGVIQTLKDLTSQYTTSNSSKTEEL
ncbi:hypothetical protein HanRHA438_Chr11g0515261 [Helianthus annuus]|uniref:Uncharacterized protein n=1 Tax=Helianthus annuus TaxID=4232 RepID=A0A251VI30_HELAN|nr:uncharacterized protein LOC110927028 [Helianthus annuus]KAF5782997.1 hypothetical protein HanXRQr2_Chr11g0502771 [Helianthus annuus]KAJ0502423.1 hypothetical protein HanHA300_Chr11g0412711 [Helianthus annuus]KAJ0510461.1 hypothetical protein HanIR_Chr11g0541051 [Helianthus annuus]KAJ0518344.1 hypothetical protein HanHA89_Chr11g0436371 [Helianthus annuus]KAJ0686376.1 hypothetical protein HanLR1_Chr11g0414031 [Helianthus annuus]